MTIFNKLNIGLQSQMPEMYDLCKYKLKGFMGIGCICCIYGC